MIRNRRRLMQDDEYCDYLYQQRKEKEAEEHFEKLEKEKQENSKHEKSK